MKRFSAALMLLCALGCAAPAPVAATPSPAPVAPAPVAATPDAASDAAAPAPAPHAAAAAPVPITAAAASPEAETSVRPGANAEYLKPDMEVAEWTARFERSGRDIYDNRAALVKATGVRPGDSIADVGAGTGLFSVLFADAVGASGRVYAVDIVPKFLAHIDARAAAAGKKNVVTILGTARSIALPAGSVDAVFLCDVYHHLEYPRSVLASIRKALKPGGRLLVIDFKRVRGVSPEWVFEHVRAGQDVFTKEIVAAGFQVVRELPLLRENYVLELRKTE